MQAENKKNNIKTLSFGCRLNAVESEKIQKILSDILPCAVVVNTCSVTGEAERQCGQTVRKIARENPDIPIFITGCGATRNPELFSKIPGTIVINNANKLNPTVYIDAVNRLSCNPHDIMSSNIQNADPKLSKKFIQIQNGCNHKCTYCVTRLLRGPSVSFDYNDILSDVIDAVNNGFYEIVLTGVDAASYAKIQNGHAFLLSDLCKQLLHDVPQIQRLRLSSVDPAVPEIKKIIDLMLHEPRIMPHLHFSMQSGCDTILKSMARRHSADMVRELVKLSNNKITFSWDIICGFPGETDDFFNETLNLVNELKPIRIHAFPYSIRPGTPAATMPNQINHHISKQRVKAIYNAARHNCIDFMNTKIGTISNVLVEENNIARTPDDIPVKIINKLIEPRSICNIKLTGIDGDMFIGELI